MLFRDNENLEELLVRFLALKPALTAAALSHALTRLGSPFSTAAVYKELKKLMECGILVKAKRRYSLSLTWALHYLSLAESIEDNYIRTPKLAVPLPKPGESVSWKFNSLLRLNDFSSHTILLLVNQTKERNVYSWNPHPWFYLVQTTQERSYLRALKRSGGRVVKVIGGETALDRWTERFWQDLDTLYRFEPTFESSTSLYYNVVGDYIESFVLEKRAVEMINFIYKTTKAEAAPDLGLLLELFRIPLKSRLKIEHNKRKAKRIRERFERKFKLHAKERY